MIRSTSPQRTRKRTAAVTTNTYSSRSRSGKRRSAQPSSTSLLTPTLLAWYGVLLFVVAVFPLLFMALEDAKWVSPSPSLTSPVSIGVMLVHMVCVSVAVVYIGAHVSAAREGERQRALQLLRKHGRDSRRDMETALAELEREVIGRSDALRIPLVASCGLFGLFLAIRYLPPQVVTWVVGSYLTVAGTASVANVLAPLYEVFGVRDDLLASLSSEHDGEVDAAEPGRAPASPTPWLSRRFRLFRGSVVVHVRDLLSMVVAVPLMVWYFRAPASHAFVLNNVFAASLGVTGIELLALGDFKSAVLLLLGLFAYDIFWVFGSESVFGDNVMVSVARGISGPFKFVFPRPRTRPDRPREFSMLGLGDLVIPGVFVALMLRFDNRHTPTRSAPPQKPYFRTAIIAYAAGMVLTFGVMAWSGVAQPALLYLVPLCLASPIALAICRGDWRSLWRYEEEEEKESGKKAPKRSTRAEAE